MKKILYMAMLALAISQQINEIPDILRLHVVANSDSQQDQAIKLKVRDAVISYLDQMEHMENEQQAEQYAYEHLAEIETVAKKELQRNGFDYEVHAQTGVFAFPEKTYGETTLPEGNYHALRITLGEGGGKNWWCVLFPPLCYIELEEMDTNWQQSDGIQYKSLLGSMFNK